jgi:hypothetical protein
VLVEQQKHYPGLPQPLSHKTSGILTLRFD